MPQDYLPYSILHYIVDRGREVEGSDEAKLPPMDDLADDLGISRGKLREEMIAAQAYGIVEMRPGDGTYVRPFDFYTAVRTLTLYSIELDRKYFDRFYELRIHLEFAFWEKAARSLGEEDFGKLDRILDRADEKLKGTPVEIPHMEHRDFHEIIFGKLDNEFVEGILKAYWDAYEAVGLHRYFDYSYYQEMWSSHREMVDAIRKDDYERGRKVMRKHFNLLESRLSGGE